MQTASRKTPRSLRIGIVDLIAKEIETHPYARLMNPNFASIMPQVVAVWAEQLGHIVTYVPFTGPEDLIGEIPTDLDVLFVCVFTQGAYLAYSLSNLFRRRGVVTVLGGPHARAYPEDALLYFDYVLGLTGKTLIENLLADLAPQPGQGVFLSDTRQPDSLPGVRERWKFIQRTLEKNRLFRFVPMIGSLGCPYKCSFCIDSQIDYQTLSYEQIKEDLIFLQKQPHPPAVGWYDPNFGVRFDDYMDVIESCVRPGALLFGAESSLSLLSEPHLQRLKKNNFLVILPGIESWFDYNHKAGQRKHVGMEKVREVAAHVNLIARYIPYVTCNFIFGLDVDEGPLPFELTKHFVDLAPGVYPKFSIITAYGHSAPLSSQYLADDRVIDVPFRFLGGHDTINVRLKNYACAEFYDYLIDLAQYAFSPPKLWARFKVNQHAPSRWMLLFRSLFGERRGHRNRLAARHHLATDPEFQAFYAGDTTKPPAHYLRRIKSGLGPFFDYLPARTLHYLEHGEPAPNTRIFKREQHSSLIKLNV